MFPAILPSLSSLGSLGLSGGPAGPSSARADSASGTSGDFNFKGKPDWIWLAAAFAAGAALVLLVKR